MLKTVTKLQNKSWEEHWKARNLTWDAGRSSPALIEIIDDLKKGNWLVPGCGYGYDVLEFSRRGHHATGLDFSPTCIDLCIQKYPKNDNFEFVCGDFFKHSKVYDGAYDYTFFCALPIELRHDWGLKMAELIKPNGTLITLMFPIDNHEGGPPFSVTPEDYNKVLKNFKLQSLTACSSFKPRQGKEKLGIWVKVCSDFP